MMSFAIPMAISASCAVSGARKLGYLGVVENIVRREAGSRSPEMSRRSSTR